MEHKHTPGPWRIGVRQPNSDKFVYGANGGEVANCDRLINFADENLANARLIAAAPELLEALRETLRVLVTHKGFPDAKHRTPEQQAAYTQARQAIAKATAQQ